MLVRPQTHRTGCALVAAGGLLAVLAGLSGCADGAAATTKARDPFVVEKFEDPNRAPRLHIEPAAVVRILLRTALIGGPSVDGERTFAGSLPYAALLYKPDGTAFVYLNPEPNVFERHTVTVADIVDGVVRYTTGPAEGHAVVTDGAAELMGIEFGVGK